MVVSNDIWHVTSSILVPRPASPFFPTLVCRLIICFVHFLECCAGLMVAITVERNKFSMMSSFVIPKKLRRNKIQELAGVVSNYRPLSNGPSTLPLRHPALMLLSADDFFF